MSKILVVEDDTALAELYNFAFTKHGYEVEAAFDGEVGLLKAQTVKPAMILLDMMMPKMNGLEVLEHLKQSDETKNIPVIILTNLADPVVEEKARAFGVTQYLLKSQYLPLDLVEIVKNIIPQSN